MGLPYDNLAVRLARKIKERIEHHGWTGKKRDDETMTLWLGAAMGLAEVGLQAESDYLLKQAAWLVSVRGFSHINSLVAEHGDNSEPKAA